MEQRTLKLDDGTIVYVYEDGSVEWLANWGRTGKRLIKTFGNNNGYGYLQVRINNKKYRVHRLICIAFHENPNNLPEVDHLDRNRKNNKSSNLRWVTRKENCDNKASVDEALKKYDVRECDDRKAYKRQYNKNTLHITKPDGSDITTGALSPEIYNLLKPMPQRERYFKYQEIKMNNP